MKLAMYIDEVIVLVGEALKFLELPINPPTGT
jgi:hypothetical protein